MKPEDEPIFHALTPQRIGGLTNYLEAGGEPDEGKIAQAWVIRNRVDHPSFQGNSVLTVCYHEAAFRLLFGHRQSGVLQGRGHRQSF